MAPEISGRSDSPLELFHEQVAAGKLPAWQSFLAAAKHLDGEELVALINLDQLHRWSAAEGRTSEDYFSAFPGLTSESELVDVVYGEFWARRQAGQLIATAVFLKRFPRLQNALNKQFEVAAWLQSGERVHSSNSALSISDIETLILAGSTVDDSPKSTPAIDSNARAPLRLDDYELQRLLGVGAMGEVYLARQISIDKLVAVKLLNPKHGNDPARVERFLQEARLVAALQHENIVGVHGVGRTTSGYFLVMDYIEGSSLDKRLNAGPLPISEAIEITATIAAALEHVHLRGIVHRDVKPSNIMLRSDGKILLTDFGLGKSLFDAADSVSVDGQIVGTPQFMSPEQARGDVSPLSDVYGIGAVLYALVTGVPPFDGGSALATLSRVVSDEAPVPLRQLRPAAPARLEMICNKCLQKNANARFASAGELREALLACKDSAVIFTTTRWRHIPNMATLLVCLAVAFGIISYMSSGKPPSVPEVAWKIDLFRSGESAQHFRLIESPETVFTGDFLRFEIELPRPQFAAAFWVDSEGIVEAVAGTDLEQRVSKIRIPNSAELGLPISGKPGTEMFLLLLRDAPLSTSDRQQILDLTFAKLPDLEPRTLVLDGQEYANAALTARQHPLDPEAARLLADLSHGPRKLEKPAPLTTGKWQQALEAYKKKLPANIGRFHFVAIAHREK